MSKSLDNYKKERGGEPKKRYIPGEKKELAIATRITKRCRKEVSSSPSPSWGSLRHVPKRTGKGGGIEERGEEGTDITSRRVNFSRYRPSCSPCLHREERSQ